jgi:adenylate cyclase
VEPLLGNNRVFKQCSVKLKGYEQLSVAYASKFGVLNTFLSLTDLPKPTVKKTAPVTAQVVERPAIYK